MNTNIALFDRSRVKGQYHCDASFVDIGLPGAMVLPQITYLFGLFTHQRDTYLWKGILQVPLLSDDDDASTFANMLNF